MNQRHRIDRLMDKSNFVGARKQIRTYLTEEPNDHWLMARMASAYNQEGKYTEGLKWARRAARRAPRCPIALWHLAHTYACKRRFAESSRILRRLIKRPLRAYLTGGTCAQSKTWAQSFVTDCCIALAWNESYRYRHRESVRAYRQHIRRREKRWGGLIGGPLREVRRALAGEEELYRRQGRRVASEL